MQTKSDQIPHRIDGQDHEMKLRATAALAASLLFTTSIMWALGSFESTDVPEGVIASDSFTITVGAAGGMRRVLDEITAASTAGLAVVLSLALLIAAATFLAAGFRARQESKQAA